MEISINKYFTSFSSLRVGLPLFILLIYLSPLIIFGQDSYILIHDNLDSNVVRFKILAESNLIFSPSETRIANIMGGIPRISLGSEFNLILWLYVLFSPYVAYVVNIFAMHFLAFLGMYLLLGRYFLAETEKHFPLIRSGVALCFSLLPFWPSGGLSVAGLPLALYAFLNIREKRENFFDWSIVCFIPFYSSFKVSFLFFLTIISSLWIFDFFFGKRNYRFLFSLVLMFLIFIIVEYRLFYWLFYDRFFISHRSEFNIPRYNISRAIDYGINNFIYGQYHAHSLHTKYVIPTVIAALGISLIIRDKLKPILLLLLLVLTISLFYGIWRWEGLNAINDNILILKSFNFSRFHWLHPLLWYLLFALSLSVFSNLKRINTPLILVIVTLQISYLFLNSNFISELKKNKISYSQFYAEEQFNEISSFIGRNKTKYRIISLGIHPAIALYNRFFTLDGYVANYPLPYKHQFRKIIAGELEKNKALKTYYDNWGSRVYLFSSELKEKGEFLINKAGNDIEISKLDISKQEFTRMGGEYILSAVKINEKNNPGINLIKLFKNSKSAWDIYLYSVSDN